MNKKWLPYVLIVVLSIALFFVRRSKQETAGKTGTVTTSPGKTGGSLGSGSGGTGSGSVGTGPRSGAGLGSGGAAGPAGSGATASKIDRNRGFDRRISYLEYTKHANCRMSCRRISRSEVEEIMQDGSINYKKSNVQSKPCPEYALEGTTHDGQHVRIVFAQCDFKTKVVTTIDLETEWSCDCPGDKN